MLYRLDAQHYINDRLLEPGHIIGDGTDVALPPWFKPSVSMTPLDGDAWNVYRETFPGVQRPERDPTKAIPLRGTGDTAKQPPLVQKGPDGLIIQPTGAGPVQTIDNVPGGYVEGKDHELKKGLPDPGSPNHPVGQPVQGILPDPATTPTVPPKPEDPAMRVNAPPAEQKAVSDAQAKAQADERAKQEAAAKAQAAAPKAPEKK